MKATVLALLFPLVAAALTVCYARVRPRATEAYRHMLEAEGAQIHVARAAHNKLDKLHKGIALAILAVFYLSFLALIAGWLTREFWGLASTTAVGVAFLATTYIFESYNRRDARIWRDSQPPQQH